MAGIDTRTPLGAHALTACRAELAEAAGDHAQAVASYAEAAERWREFGNVPERAYALLGQARCTLTLGHAGADVPPSPRPAGHSRHVMRRLPRAGRTS
jgi:hypothetical protein